MSLSRCPTRQPQLEELEKALGGEVLERSTAGVPMTELGERVYAHARRVLAELDELSASLDEMYGRMDPVRLAISHTAAE